MKYREINLLGGFYKDASLPWSSQDTVNWLPVPAQAEGTRSPMKLRGAPGLRALNEDVDTVVISGDAPNTTCGAAYSFAYSVEGGTPPYSWSVQSGQLPSGLTFSAGTISGTVACPVVEFGEVTAPPFTGGVYYAFNTSDINLVPPTEFLQTVPAGTKTILVALNDGQIGSSRTMDYTAYIDGSPVGPAFSVVNGDSSPVRWFAYDVSTATTFWLERAASTQNHQGSFYAYTQTASELFPGTPVGSASGGTFNFVIRAQDASGIADTHADSITVTPP